MTDTTEQNGDRTSFPQPQGDSSLPEQQQQEQQQQHPSAFVRIAQALKRTRARDILQDGASEVPAEKRTALAKHSLFDHFHQHQRQDERAQSQTPQRSNQTLSQASNQPHRRKTTDTVETLTTLLDPTILYGKTWKLHRTTPFHRYDPRQATRDGSELLSYMTANAPKLTIDSAVVAQAAASIAASGRDGEPATGGHPSSIVEATGGVLSTLSITERAARPFPPQINKDGENIVERVDVVNEVKRVVFEPLDLSPEEDEEDEVRKMSSSFIISIVISYRGKTADQTFYIALIDDLSKRINHNSNGAAAANGNIAPFTHFTLVMAKAPAALTAVVMEWLERKYDCRICPLVFPTYELRTFVDRWLEYLYGSQALDNVEEEQEVARALKKAKVKSIELHYGFPEGVQGMKTMAISLASDDVREMCNSREAGSIAGPLEGIEDHCSYSMRIDFGRLILKRVGCPSWYLASEGKLKNPRGIENSLFRFFVRLNGTKVISFAVDKKSILFHPENSL